MMGRTLRPSDRPLMLRKNNRLASGRMRRPCSLNQPKKPMNSDINTNRRLFDLVRVMRSELHEADLISDEEYSWLLSEAPMAKRSGSPSPRRLEDYDDMRARMKRMESALKDIVAAANGEGALWHGSSEIENARRALDSENAELSGADESATPKNQ